MAYRATVFRTGVHTIVVTKQLGGILCSVHAQVRPDEMSLRARFCSLEKKRVMAIRVGVFCLANLCFLQKTCHDLIF